MIIDNRQATEPKAEVKEESKKSVYTEDCELTNDIVIIPIEEYTGLVKNAVRTETILECISAFIGRYGIEDEKKVDAIKDILEEFEYVRS